MVIEYIKKDVSLFFAVWRTEYGSAREHGIVACMLAIAKVTEDSTAFRYSSGATIGREMLFILPVILLLELSLKLAERGVIKQAIIFIYFIMKLYLRW